MEKTFWKLCILVCIFSIINHKQSKARTPGESLLSLRVNDMSQPTQRTTATLPSQLLSYTRQELLLINTLCTDYQPENWTLIEKFKSYVLSIKHRKKTKRGTRAGKRKFKKNDKSRMREDPSHETNLNICTWNARSARNKTTDISDMIIEKNLDLIFITESWIHETGDDVIKAELTPSGYKILNKPRMSGDPGGGIAIIYRSNLQISISNQSHENITSFEYFETKFTSHQGDIHFVCVYRPPPSKKNKLKLSTFVDEFTDFIHTKENARGKLLIFGDINIHFDQASDTEANKIKSYLDSLSLEQLITVPTHNRGHTLDWVIVRKSENILKTTDVVDLQMSDHFPIFCELDLARPKRQMIKKQCRNIRDINRQKFMDDISASPLCKDNVSLWNIDEHIELYNTVLAGLLDNHAPMREKRFSIKPLSPWYNDGIKAEKIVKRTLEKQWKKTNLEINRQMYIHQRNKLNYMIRKAKMSYISAKVLDCDMDSKKLFALTASLLNKSKESALPDCGSSQETADKFATYFKEKIETIHKKLLESQHESCQNSTPDLPEENDSGNGIKGLFELHPFTLKEIETIIKLLPAKSCELDPIPTTLLLECIDVLAHPITEIINKSVATATVPKSFKQAIVRPLLKKDNLDPNTLKNYRPVSNLPFLSKLLEKAVSIRLSVHLSNNDLLEGNQSAYRPGHSTETALLKVMNDLLCGADEGKISLLVLLDLSAAFDTIDHNRLLSRLRNDCYIGGKALDWFDSYLTNRYQRTVIHGTRSETCHLHCGVPQGSVLGPLLFTLYTKPLSRIASIYGINQHQYADDNQLYQSTMPAELPTAIEKMEKCCSNIKDWMTINLLKLNDDKTELILIGSKGKLKSLLTHSPGISLQIGEAKISPTPKAKNLGVWIDENLSLEPQVTHICKSANLHLRNIGRLRPYLSQSASTKLVLSTVMSRLDYCNSLLVNMNQVQLRRLQLIQNRAARIISRAKKHDHIKPVLKQLHWLPVTERIEYKILTHAFRVFYGLAPKYLCDTLDIYKPTRGLRSQDKLLFKQYLHRTLFGKRSFKHAAVTKWNTLPTDIKSVSTLDSFKKHLKTHLFLKCF